MLFCEEKSVAICWLVVHVFHMCCKLRVYIALLCVLRHLMADERDVAAGGFRCSRALLVPPLGRIAHAGYECSICRFLLRSWLGLV